MSTTDILFNSPALHSLKRAQLVQLCKRHNIRASGKNVELVDRLKEHARSLPNDNPLNVAIRSEKHSGYPIDDRTSEDGSEDEERFRPQRPSEMWEVVMDDIPEEENYGSLPGSLSSKSMLTIGASGEFGTGGSSQSTIGSSIKALATSLGLSRSASATSIPTSESKDTITSLKSIGKGKSSSNSNRKVLSNLNSSANARDSLTANAIPYSAIPPARISQLPIIEPFAFSCTEQADTSISSVDQLVPGIGSRIGTDANASVGMETVRLITASSGGKRVPESPALPRLAPIKPSFDLVPPTPGNTGLKKWPLSPGAKEGESASGGLYPSLNIEKVISDSASRMDKDEDVDMPGGLVSSEQAVDRTRLSPSRPEPFIFGSPHPRHSASKGDFTKAANSVLAEMNARLGLSDPSQAVGLDLLRTRTGDGTKLSEEEILNYQFGGKKANQTKDDEEKAKGSVGWKFDRAHEKEFSKMEGIDTHYAARRMQSKASLFEKEAQEPLAPLPANRKRKSTANEESSTGLGKGRPSTTRTNKRRSSNARVISAGARRKMGMGIPGGFGDDEEEEEEEEEEPQVKRVCVEQPAADNKPATRVSIAPNAVPGKSEDVNGEETRRQSEAIKRRLELNKARRRSSRGRPSIAPRGSLAAQKQKGATSRFGFLSSAKSLVNRVWNRGAGGPSTASSSIPVSKPAQTKAATTLPEQMKNAPKPAPAPVAKPPIPDAKKPSFDGIGIGSNGRPSMSTSSRAPASRNVSSTSSNGFLKPGDAGRAHASGSVRSTNSAMSTSSAVSAVSASSNASDRRLRSPIPSFNVPGDSLRGRKISGQSQAPIFGSTRTRNSSIKGSVGSMGPPSSMGTRTSTASNLSSGTGTTNGVGSMGTKPRMRPSSTLYAPTASSLAKTNANLARRSSVLNKNADHSTSSRHSSALSPSKIPVILPLSPRKKNLSAVGSGAEGERSIFSSPFVLPTSPAAKEAARTGQTVNPITGIPSPIRANTARVLPSIEQSFGSLGSGSGLGSASATGSVNSAMGRNPSVQRKPRISRSKVIAKLGAQRAASHSSSHNSTAGAMDASGAVNGTRKGRTRSSVGAAVARRSVGAVKARGSGVNGAAVMMSAKRRVRMSEYARRRSTKAPADLDMDLDD